MALTGSTRMQASSVLMLVVGLALDFGRDKAVFSVFRHASEVPLYRIEKCPGLARRQGAYAVVAATGLVMKRGHDLARVLAVLGKELRLVAV